MRSKIIGALLCILVLCATVWLIFKAPLTVPEQNPSNTEEASDITEETVPTELSRAYVIETAHDAEDLIEKLAYGKSDDYEKELKDLQSRLSASGNFMKDELQDYEGATYFIKLAQIFSEIINTPFVDSTTFSQRVTQILTELENAYPADAAASIDENHPDTPMYYPKFETDANSKTTLALLAIFRLQYQKATGSILITIGGNMVAGDTLLDTEKSESFKGYSEKSKYTYPLYALSSVLSNDDSSYANLESPLTDSIGNSTVAGSVKGLPSYAKFLKDGGIDAVSVANSSILLFGESGKNDTVKALEDAKLLFSDEGTITYHQTKLGTVAYLSYDIEDEIKNDTKHGFVDTPKNDIAAAKAAGAKFVVVHFNWVNTEKNSWDPSMAQVLTARAAVDNGACLVFGSHTNAIEAIEQYNGVSIVYSPGDLFRRNGGDATSFLFQQAFTLDNDGNAIPGQILLVPLSGSGSEQGLPSPALDGSSADAFRKTIKNSSSTVKYGVNKKNTFTVDHLNIISINK